MSPLYFNTVKDANKEFKKINRDPVNNLNSKKTYENTEYTYYGKTTISTSLSSKVLKIAQIIACAVLIFFSAGLYQPFKDYLKHKYNTFNETSFQIYVKEKFKNNSQSDTQGLVNENNELLKKMKRLKEILDKQTDQNALEQMKKSDELKDFFERIDKKPEDLRLETNQNFLNQQVETYAKNGKLQEAIVLNGLISNKDIAELNYCEIAKAYFNQNNFKEALAVLNKYIRGCDTLYRNFAIACCKQGKFDEAIEFIRVGFPNYFNESKREVFLQVAEKHYNSNNYDEALKTLKHLNDSDGEDLYLKISEKYIQNNLFDEATQLLSKVTKKQKEKNALLSKLPIKK